MPIDAGRVARCPPAQRSGLIDRVPRAVVIGMIGHGQGIRAVLAGVLVDLCNEGKKGSGLISFRYELARSVIVKVISIRYQLPVTCEPNTPDRIAELLVHVGRTAQSEDARSELTAAQWTCLRFFARANVSTRTPSAFASFQATTRGTASQIIKSLEQRGLVARSRSERDRRSVCFDLTEQGRATLARDPLRDLVGLIGGLGEAESARFLLTLSRLSSALSARRGAPAFGTCRDCSHFGTSGDAAYCACMAAQLAADEMHKLCASYTPALGAASQGGRDGAA